MTYLARELISSAYNLSGIVARDLQSVTGAQSNLGLRLLNSMLAMKACDKSLIPYFDEIIVAGVIGQERYFLENVVEVESVTFNIGQLRYPTRNQGRKNYFGSARYDAINSLPFSWHVERCVGGSNLFLYFKPNDTYSIKVWGKLAFDDTTLDTDLSTVFDGYYLEYIRYELAAVICNEYQITLQAQTAEWLEDLRNKVRDESPIDLRMVRKTRFTNNAGLNYGDINLGSGWRPPS